MICEYCKFWRPLEPSGPNRPGRCRRFPPQITTRVFTNAPSDYLARDYPEVESSTETKWPETLSSDTCGEFRQK